MPPSIFRHYLTRNIDSWYSEDHSVLLTTLLPFRRFELCFYPLSKVEPKSLEAQMAVISA